MYPLNMTNKAAGGYAAANDEIEHKSLSDAGYEPKFDQSEEQYLESVEDLRAKLDAAGIPYDKRFGVEKLKALLPAE